MVSVNEGGTCAQVPAAFSSTVWPAMSTSCTSCHMPGKVAFGSNLVFVVGGTELQQYNVVRNYAKTSSDTLLAKVIGGLNHSGGAPFVNAQSAQYKALSDLVPEMKQPCTSGTAQAQGQFWKDVTFNDDQTKLAKAAILFAGRNPTSAEAAAVMNGGAPVLRGTIRSFMTGVAFDRFLDEAGEAMFLSRGVTVFGNNMGLNANDLPSAAPVINNDATLAAGVRNNFILTMQREPVELMKYIVKNDKPWTDMVEGKYTVVNSVQSQYLAARLTGTFVDPMDLTEFLPAVLPNRAWPVTASTPALSPRMPGCNASRRRRRTATAIARTSWRSSSWRPTSPPWRPVRSKTTARRSRCRRSRTRTARRATRRWTRWRPASRTGTKPTATCRTAPRPARITRCPTSIDPPTIRRTRTARPITWTATTGSVTSTRRATTACRCLAS
jgi:hypothetical protein